MLDLDARVADHPLATRVFQAITALPWSKDDLARCCLNALDGLGTAGGRAATVEDLVAALVELQGSDAVRTGQPYKPAVVMTWISNAMRRRTNPSTHTGQPLSPADQLKARRLAREAQEANRAR